MNHQVAFATVLRNLLTKQLDFNPSRVDSIINDAHPIIDSILQHAHCITESLTLGFVDKILKVCNQPRGLSLQVPQLANDRYFNMLFEAAQDIIIELPQEGHISSELAQGFVDLILLNTTTRI